MKISYLIEKLIETNRDMAATQDKLYVIRKMTEEDFCMAYGPMDNLRQLYQDLKSATDLNAMRAAYTDALDELFVEHLGKITKKD